MITGELRNQVDKLWTEFWTGGITNPLMVIDQDLTPVSFFIFARSRRIRPKVQPFKPIHPIFLIRINHYRLIFDSLT